MIVRDVRQVITGGWIVNCGNQVKRGDSEREREGKTRYPCEVSFLIRGEAPNEASHPPPNLSLAWFNSAPISLQFFDHSDDYYQGFPYRSPSLPLSYSFSHSLQPLSHVFLVFPLSPPHPFLFHSLTRFCSLKPPQPASRSPLHFRVYRVADTVSLTSSCTSNRILHLSQVLMLYSICHCERISISYRTHHTVPSCSIYLTVSIILRSLILPPGGLSLPHSSSHGMGPGGPLSPSSLLTHSQLHPIDHTTLLQVR